MAKKFPKQLYLRANTWMIRVQIPKDVQPFFGNKAELLQSTKKKEAEVEEAKLIRDGFVASFKLRVRRIRSGEDLSHINDLEFTPEYWSQLQRDDRSLPKSDPSRVGLGELQFQFVHGATDEAIDLYLDGGMNRLMQTTNPNKMEALEDLDPTAYQKVVEHLSIVQGETFGAMIDQYMSTRAVEDNSSKYKAEKLKHLKAFADQHPMLESINKAVVSDWIENLERQGHGSSTISTRTIILRGYWEYLMLKGLVDENKVNPFSGHKIAKKVIHKREMFTIDEAKLLVRGNENIKPDEHLEDFIKLAFLTGCRVIELTSITESNIILHENLRVIDITENMTKGSAKRGAIPSGVRKIPLTSKMEPIIDRLISNWEHRKCHPDNASKGLVFDTGKDQYGDITRSMSKQFNNYKKKLGFPDKIKSAHSTRHTANNILARKQVNTINRTSLFGWIEGSNVSMADTVYANQEFAYPYAQRKEHLEILGEEFWFI